MSSRSDRIDLGLELARKNARPGVPMSQSEIAEWCGCSKANIHQIEQKAMKRLREQFRFNRNPVTRDAVDSLTAR